MPDGNVALELYLSGADAGTTFVDKSNDPKTIVVNGDAQTSTAQSKFYGSSLLLDGTGDYLQVDNVAGINVNGEDFCIECWVRRPTSVGTSQTIFSFEDTGSADYWAFYWRSTDHITMFMTSPGVVIEGTTALVADTWYHMAWSREGTTYRCFVDGNLEDAAVEATTMTAFDLVIGSSAGQDFAGNMQDVRLTKGNARYTESFTPPPSLLSLEQSATAPGTHTIRKPFIISNRPIQHLGI
jgi:hypothetical protein